MWRLFPSNGYSSRQLSSYSVLLVCDVSNAFCVASFTPESMLKWSNNPLAADAWVVNGSN